MMIWYLMNWYAIAFVTILSVAMIVAGYYLIKKYLREYTYEYSSKTQKPPT